jgi:hypothetical protein
MPSVDEDMGQKELTYTDGDHLNCQENKKKKQNTGSVSEILRVAHKNSL